MGIKSIVAISLITVLLIGAVSFDDAFAKDKKEKLTKLQKECAKEPKKDNKIKPECELLELIDTLTAQIALLQSQLIDFSFTQTNLNEPVLEIQVDPASNEPALIVTDGTDPLFIVNNDGSIQIGSNTVIINPDGTVTGSPLFLETGSTVGGNLISTGPHTTNTNAETICGTGELLDGDGNCQTIPTGSSYTNADAINALQPHITTSDAHHALYTDARARSAVGSHTPSTDIDPTNELQSLTITEIEVKELDVPANSQRHFSTVCPSGTSVIGGGFEAKRTNFAGFVVFASVDMVQSEAGNSNNWNVSVFNPHTFSIDLFKTTAMCATLN